MATRNSGKLNQLLRTLPEGLLVDAAWLSERGYSTSLRSQYVSAGWLEQPARGVYRRPGATLKWQQAVVSLQSLLGWELVVGGRTALELQGFAHYLSQVEQEVHLYGPKAPPSWLKELRLGVRFEYHNSKTLFEDRANEVRQSVVAVEQPGLSDRVLKTSAPERAVLELLDELPKHESFHQVDVLMEGLTSLSPARLQRLLVACRSVKVKRLFFFFAERHHHSWFKRLDPGAVDLGQGKRGLVSGGRLDRTYQITVPEELYGVS